MRTLHHNIWMLLRARYPRFAPPVEPISIEDLKEHFENWADNFSLLEDEEIGKFRSAEKHLSKLINTENIKLQGIVNSLLAETESEHPFNRNGYLATDETYMHWLKCEYLTTEEAAALSLGRNPEKTSEILNEQHLGLDVIQSKIKETMRILNRLESVRTGDGLLSQSQFIEWIASSDSEQRDIILKFNPESSSLSSKTQGSSRTSAQTNERNTMLRLIIGMAIAKYKYDPAVTHGSAVTKIHNSLIEHGIKISDDTIRKYLREAQELLPENY